MSSYLPPNHNRLLDLEHHLRGQQSGARSTRQRPLGRPAQRQRPAGPSLQTPPLPRAQRSQTPPPQALDNQPLSQRLGKPPARRQSRQSRLQVSQPRRNPELAAPNPALQKPRRHEQSSGPYRQLAAQLGKHYRFTPLTRTSKADLPAIPTPIRTEIVETFSASSPKWATSAKPWRQPITLPVTSDPTPSTPPTPPTPSKSRPSSPPPQISWKALATTIRQARQGLVTQSPISAAPAAKPRPPAIDWTIDEMFMAGVDPETVQSSDVPHETRTAVPSAHKTHSPDPSIPDNRAIALAVLDKNAPVTPAPMVQVEFISPAISPVLEPTEQNPVREHQPDEIPAAAVTIDVIPVASAEETDSDATKPKPASPAMLPHTPEPEHRINARADTQTQSVTARDKSGLRNKMLLLTYQKAFPPQIVGYMAQLQRKQSKQKHNKQRNRSPTARQKKSRPPHRNAS